VTKASRASPAVAVPSFQLCAIARSALLLLAPVEPVAPVACDLAGEAVTAILTLVTTGAILAGVEAFPSPADYS